MKSLIDTIVFSGLLAGLLITAGGVQAQDDDRADQERPLVDPDLKPVNDKDRDERDADDLRPERRRERSRRDDSGRVPVVPPELRDQRPDIDEWPEGRPRLRQDGEDFYYDFPPYDRPPRYPPREPGEVVTVNEDAASMGISVRQSDRNGIVIVKVVEEGPAHKADLKPGDQIRALAGYNLRNVKDLIWLLNNRRSGDVVRVVYDRYEEPHQSLIRFQRREEVYLSGRGTLHRVANPD